DAPALEALFALCPGELNVAQALARIYTQAGKGDDARRVLRTARTYHPKDVTLWEQAVKAASNLAEEEAAYRELIRNFPEDVQYAVAVGSVRVDRGGADEARKVLEPLVTKESGAVLGLAHYHLARAEFKDGQPDRALKPLEAATKADAETVTTPAALLFE